MTDVYIVFGSIDYEGSSPLRAFEFNESANSFKAECIFYDAAEPEYGDDDKTWAKHDEWEQRHPSGSGKYDSYYIETMELHR